MTSFVCEFNNYKIHCELQPTTSSFKLNIRSPVTYALYSYEIDEIERKANNLLSLPMLFNFLQNGFNNKDSHECKTIINLNECDGFLLLDVQIVSILLNESLSNFKLSLKKQIESSNTSNARIEELLERITMLEEKQKTNEQMIECLGNSCIVFKCQSHGCVNADNIINMNAAKVTIIGYPNITNVDQHLTDFTNLKYLFKLESLRITSFRNTSIEQAKLEHPTLKTLEIINNDAHMLKSIEGIDKFPELEHLLIVNAYALQGTVSVLSSTTHKIKKIDITSINGNTSLTTELNTYCVMNGIQLTIK